MNRVRIFFTAQLLLVGCLATAAEDQSHFLYPRAPKSNQIDDYFGTKIADPYRELENADSQPTRKWIEAENKLTFDYLTTIPERNRIKERLTALWNYERYGVPFHEGRNYFFTNNIAFKFTL